jgi:hypothetical protein
METNLNNHIVVQRLALDLGLGSSAESVGKIVEFCRRKVQKSIEDFDGRNTPAEILHWLKMLPSRGPRAFLRTSPSGRSRSRHRTHVVLNDASTATRCSVSFHGTALKNTGRCVPYADPDSGL